MRIFFNLALILMSISFSFAQNHHSRDNSSSRDRNNYSNNYSNNESNLRLGYKFTKNQKIHSPNHQYHLIFQSDGNLVIYDRYKSVIWDSKTTNRGNRAEFQRDGNLVIYDRRNRAIFSSDTPDRGGRALKIQDDGNLVIYAGGANPIWASENHR